VRKKKAVQTAAQSFAALRAWVGFPGSFLHREDTAGTRWWVLPGGAPGGAGLPKACA